MDTDEKPNNIEREQETQKSHRQGELPGDQAALPGGQAGREG